MSELPQVKARDLVKTAQKLGFTLRDQSGSHAVYTHPDGRKTTIPVHPSETIGVGLLMNVPFYKFTQICKKIFTHFKLFDIL